MFKKVVEVLLVCFLSFVLFSCDSSSDSDEYELSSLDFTLNVYARNEVAFISWGKVKTDSTAKDFEKIEIDYGLTDGESKTITIENPLKTKQKIITNLENQKEYNFTFTGYIENQKFIKQAKVTPQKVEANAARKIAIYQSGNTYINFTLPEFLNGESGETNFSKVNVYTIAGEKISDSEYKESLVPFYEVISADVQEDSTKTYQKYYSIVVEGEYSSLDVRLLTSENVETESFTIEPKKATLPIINIEYETTDENIEKFKNKKKIDSTLTVKNYDGTSIQGVGLTVKARGNSSWLNAPKKSYTLKFSKKQALLDFNENKSFALVANYFDKSLLRNITAYELANTVFTNMAWAPNVKSAHLFINGVYSGLYGVTETIKIGSKRVDIKDISDCENAEDFENYGYILEIDERMEENLNWFSPKNVPFNLKEPDIEDLKEDIQESVKTKIEEKVNSIEDKLYSDDFNDSSSENYYENYLDSSSFVDWWLLEELAKNTDSNFFSSCYMYYNPSEKKFFMGPVWDFDLGFGNINSYNSLEESYSDLKAEEVSKSTDGKVCSNWILRLLEDSAFKEKVKSRWNEVKPLVQDYFSASGAFEQNYNKIEPDSALNFARYEILGEAVWKSPAGYESRTTYLSEKDFFLEWVNARIEWLNSAINAL